MKKTIFTILTSICLIILFGLTNMRVCNVAYATGENQPTVFMITPSLIATANGDTYVYDSTDLSIKKIEKTAANSTSYVVGEIKDMCAHNKQILMLTDSGLKVFDTETFELSTIALDWLTSSYNNIAISIVDSKVVLSIYGDTTSVAIKTAEYATNAELIFHNVTIADSTHGEKINYSKYVYFDNTEYLIRISESNVIFYPLTIGDDTALYTTTVVVKSDSEFIEHPELIIGIEYNDNLILSYADKTDVYALEKNASNITATLADSLAHHYNQEQNSFGAIDISLWQDKLYLLSSDSYYVANLLTMEYSDKMSNALCTENYLSKAQYKYYKVTSPTNLISTLGNSNFVDVPQNAYVAEIATSTLSDGTALVGYKFVLYTEINTSGNATNHYGYIFDNNCLSLIETEPQSGLVNVFTGTKIYTYPTVHIAETIVEHQNQIDHRVESDSPVNVLAYLGEYKTGNGENAVSYALVDNNGHVGFIDIKTIISESGRTINTMPNAQIIAGTNVYEQANKTSNVISHLEQNNNVRIVGTRDRNGFIKVAFNTSEGKYYEGYILASSVRANSYTIMQTIGTVLVVLNIILLSVLIATKKRITK